MRSGELGRLLEQDSRKGDGEVETEEMDTGTSIGSGKRLSEGGRAGTLSGASGALSSGMLLEVFCCCFRCRSKCYFELN